MGILPLAADRLMEPAPRGEAQSLEITSMQCVDQERSPLYVDYGICHGNRWLEQVTHLLSLVQATAQSCVFSRDICNQAKLRWIGNSPRHHRIDGTMVQALMHLY